MAIMSGGLVRYDEHDETRSDFSRWKGIYETLQCHKRQYVVLLQKHNIVDS